MNIVPTSPSSSVAPPVLTQTSSGPSFAAYLGPPTGTTSDSDTPKPNALDRLEIGPSAQGAGSGSSPAGATGTSQIWSTVQLLDNRAAGFSETGLEGLGGALVGTSGPEAGSGDGAAAKTILGASVNEANGRGVSAQAGMVATEQSALPTDNVMFSSGNAPVEAAPNDVLPTGTDVSPLLSATLTTLTTQDSEQKSPLDGVEQDKNTVDFNDMASGMQSINVSEDNGQINLAVMDLVSPLEQDQFLRNAQMIVYHLGMTLGRITYNGKTV